MEQYSTININNLNSSGVILKINDTNIYCFSNTIQGRKNLYNLLGENNKYYDAILSIWGEDVISEETNNEEKTDNTIMTSFDRIVNLENSLTDIQLALVELYEQIEGE